MRLDFARRRFARIHLSWLCSEKTRLMRVFCSKGTAIYDDTAGPEKIRVIGEGVDSRLQEVAAPLERSYGPGRVEIPEIEEKEPLLEEGLDFIDWIARGRKPLSAGEMGCEVVSVMEAASRSMDADGAPVTL